MQGLTQWAEELDDTQLLENIGDIGVAALRRTASLRRRDFPSQRIDSRLPEMELSPISRHLQSGEAAIILSPDRAAVVPAGQLFRNGHGLGER